MEQPLALQNGLLYLWGIAFNGINWVNSAMGVYGKPQAWLGNIGHVQVGSMVFFAVYGLSISVILKRFGAITRIIVGCLAIVCTSIIDFLFFHIRLTFLEMTCFATIFMAIGMYSIVAPEYAPGGARAVQQLRELMAK